MLARFGKNSSGCSPGMVLLLERGLAGESADNPRVARKLIKIRSRIRSKNHSNPRVARKLIKSDIFALGSAIGSAPGSAPKTTVILEWPENSLKESFSP